MSQHRREQSMGKFRSGKADILVATDVASRGIDVPRVELVINYDVPNQEMAYFHRIGRTARAGAKGKAVTFVSYSSVGDWNLIKRQIKVPLTDLNQEMGIQISIPDPLKRQTEILEMTEVEEKDRMIKMVIEIATADVVDGNTVKLKDLNHVMILR
jgi:ATP-dependent RNA helicase DeaD